MWLFVCVTYSIFQVKKMSCRVLQLTFRSRNRNKIAILGSQLNFIIVTVIMQNWDNI